MKKAILILGISCGAFASYAQSVISTNGKKFVVAEESTGAWCQYCPDGAVKLAELIAGNPQVIGVSIHGGQGSDKMKFADGDTWTAACVTGFPSGLIDRALYTGKLEVNRSYWTTAASARAAVTPLFDVTLYHGFDKTTGVITARVISKALSAVTGKYNMNVFVIEDSVTGSGSGWDQVNYYNTQAGHLYYNAGSPIKGFQHMHVVRAMLGGVWGQTGVIPQNAAKDKKSSYTFTYTLPTGFNYKHFKLVAMVQKESTDINDRAYDNAIEAKLTPAIMPNPAAVGNMSALANIEVYPNPAADNIRVTGTVDNASELQISVVNAIGQTVINRSITPKSGSCDETLNVSGLANGLYMVQVRSAEGQSNAQVVVQH